MISEDATRAAAEESKSGDKSLEDMFKMLGDMESSGLSANSSKEDVDKMVEQMMGKFLSKDYLEQPMRDLCSKYPTYLKENKGKIPATDYANYEKQYECFQRICKLFDTDPENSTALSNLMTELQTYGQPPKDILSQMVPPGMDPNMDFSQGFPGMGPPGADGLPSGMNEMLNDPQFKEMMNGAPDGCKMQ